jgi:Ni,Fe-hydrogenase III large subunit/Ni,Fe-hydrogenase III component G
MKFSNDPTILEWVKKEAVPEGLEFRMGRENRVFVQVKPDDVDRIAERFTNKMGVRLSHESGVDLQQEGFDIIYSYDFTKYKDRLQITIEARIPRENPRIPSVAKVTYQAVWPERETKEFLGVDFIGTPDPRHQFLPYEWPNNPETGITPEMEKSTYIPETGWKPIGFNPKDAKAALLPIGPYHPGVIEGQTVYVKVEGEHVIDADIKTGYHHRGIQRLIERRGYNKGIFAAERVCGICSAHHGIAFVTAVENLYDAEVPDRGLYIRTLLAELNRIHSHILWIGVVADVIGWKTGFMLTWGLREQVMDIIEALTGNRVNYGVWRIGGVSRDITQEQAERYRKTVLGLKESLARLLPPVADHPILKSRVVDVGPMDLATCIATGAVGPVARASNWKIDVRKDNPPHAIYDQKMINWDIVVDDHRDTLGRVLVRVGELFVSMEIVVQCLDYLAKTTGEIRIKPKTIEPGAEAVGLNEAPRGELYYYIRAGGTDLPEYMMPEGKHNLQGSNQPQCVRIRTPSYRNNACLPYMLKGCELADVPVIMGSVDQCLACTDRVEVINVKDESSYSLSWDELVRMSQKRWRG